jgi:hypothetical protein
MEFYDLLLFVGLILQLERRVGTETFCLDKKWVVRGGTNKIQFPLYFTE